jgi:hypothetical protein
VEQTLEQKLGKVVADKWLEKFQIVETWQVVLDMKSKQEAVELANYHATQRDGYSAIQVLRRFVPKQDGPVDVEVVNEDWRIKE